MTTLERIRPENVALFRAVRLEALRDRPSAFGSTFENESQLNDEAWLARASQHTGERSIGYLAVDGAAGCGIAVGFLDEDDTSQAHLVSMWVAPLRRRHGIGRSLVTAIVDWAGERGATQLNLMVTSSNDSAIRFYEQLGFRMTGRTEPYPNDATLVEFEMSRAIS